MSPLHSPHQVVEARELVEMEVTQQVESQVTAVRESLQGAEVQHKEEIEKRSKEVEDLRTCCKEMERKIEAMR